MRVRVLSLVVCGVVALTGAARADDDGELKKLREEVIKLRDKATNAEVEMKLLQDRNKQLEERIHELGKEVERLRKKDGGPPAGGGNAPPEQVEGLVKAVEAKAGLVTITIGSDAGLRKGHTLDVYRLKPAPKYLGQIEIIDVTPARAVAKILGKDKDAIEAGDSVSSGVHKPAEEKKWGTVKGQVTWGGKMPAPGSENVVVNVKNKGLKNAYVWLTDPDDEKKAPPINPALKAGKDVQLTVQQVGPVRRFEPHVLAIQAGQAVRVKNDTAVPDNVGILGGDGTDIACPFAPGKEASINLAASRRPYLVESAIFPAMRGYVRVFDHPYFALTDAEGKFEIKGAPAGKYNIIIWHEETGWVNGGKRGQTITIPAGKAVEVNEKAKPEE
jgi:hypothetical protein